MALKARRLVKDVVHKRLRIAEGRYRNSLKAYDDAFDKATAAQQSSFRRAFTPLSSFLGFALGSDADLGFLPISQEQFL